MLVLVHRLDGTGERVELPSRATVSDLRAQLGQRLPKFREIRILQGERELTDGFEVGGEVTAVITQSPAKALASLDGSVAALEDIRFYDCRHVGASAEANPDFQVHKGKLLVAMQALGEMGTIAPEHCARLLALFPRMRELSDFQPQWFAELFVGACGHLAPHVHPLLQKLHSRSAGESRFAVLVCAEVTVRHGAEVLPHELREAVLARVEQFVSGLMMCRDPKFAVCLLRLLGQYGGASHEHVLRNHLGDDECPRELHADITAALASIRAREALVAAEAAARAEADADADGDPEAGPRAEHDNAADLHARVLGEN